MIVRSPYPDLDIPEASLTDFVLERAAERGDRAALIDGVTGRTITYAELPGLVSRAAAGLAARGIRKGDVCAIYSPNTIEYAIAVHAVATLGAAVTTVNPFYTVDEICTQLADARATMMFTAPALAEPARTIAKRLGMREVITFGEAEGTTPFSALLEAAEPAPRIAIDPARDLIALPYSSGTTGLPKGVMLSHRNLVANVLQLDATGPIRDGEDTILGFLPFFHIYGLLVIMQHGLYRGGTIVVMPRFELEAALALIQKHRVSVAYVVPPVVLLLTNSPLLAQHDLSSIRMLFSGAAPLGGDVAGRCAERVDCVVAQGYGMTESSPVTHACPGNPPRIKAGSVGVCVPNTEVRIVDVATGASLGPNESGELWIRGPQVMMGYLNCPDATRDTVDEEGWLHTGDIGYVDDEGFFFIVDRLKELIKYKGLQIAPAELEAILLAHPCIGDAAVVGIADQEAGEVPKAFVVLKAPVSTDEIQEFVGSRVAHHKRLRQVEIVDQIPKSPSGKILRRMLRDRDKVSR
ncbi:MAG TPA: AMP-binding protein [Gemmatimonadaceae bacterium]|nr:AMP-binding protein [Gemmatimonadaceae bacterium]